MMKNISFYLLTCITLSFAACNDEVESWNSATFDYAGRFVVSATCREKPSKDILIDKGNEIYIYNSAANVADEIWIDDVLGKIPLKCKFRLNGSPASFSSVAVAENIKSLYYIYNNVSGKYVKFTSDNKEDFPVATAVGQTAAGISEYIRASIQEGKILPKLATSPGGNVTDSVYVSFVLQSETVDFVSELVPEIDWKTPGVPEYGWKVKDGTNVPAPDLTENWVVSGYRYTGYPEDM
ncbi:MAG: hypothetical protein LBG92_08190 [Prevotellaceae bacterium]|jgi:hypothetical protein|nr:hypothetical protein [Prevotellaceae bacterium]